MSHTSSNSRMVRPHRWRGGKEITGALLLVVTLMSGMGLWSPAMAQDASEPFWGYLWAGDSTAESYTPDAEFQHTSTGEEMTILRNRAGEYIVTLPVFADPGTAQATAYETTPHTCTIGSWAIGEASTEVWVQCWDDAGALADSRFSLFIASGVAVAPSAYLTHGPESPASGEPQTPDAIVDFNSTGGTNTVTGYEPGRYAVTIPGFGANANGNIQVSTVPPTEADARTTCTVESWAPLEDASSDLGVWVDCFDATGQPVDAPFSLLYVTSDAATDGTTGASYWSNSGTTEFSTSGEAFTVTATDVGTYEIRMPGVGINTHWGNVQVTALTLNDAIWCAPVFFGSDEPATVITVQCANAAGEIVDADYTVMWVRN